MDNSVVMKGYTVIMDADGDLTLLDDEHSVWTDGDDLDGLLTSLQVVPGTRVFVHISVSPLIASAS